MAANKFATMLHRNTNKITLILVYAILEWILIILLLLNSLFSYLIIKFSECFGLKRPCLWCSRLDHIIEQGKNKNSYRDLICEAHASEISKLGYCLNHKKLAESQDMCEECSSSFQPDHVKLSKNFGFFPWMNQIGIIQEGDGTAIVNGEESPSCSCCGVNLDSRLYPPCILINPSWGVLDYTQKQNLITQEGVDAEIDEADHSDGSRSDFVVDHHEDERSTEENRENHMASDSEGSRSNFVVDHHEDEQSTEENRENHMASDSDGGSGKREEDGDDSYARYVCDGGKEIVDDKDYKLDMVIENEQEYNHEESMKSLMDYQFACDQTTKVACRKDTSQEISPQHLEFYIDRNDCHLVPVELIGSTTSEIQNQNRYKVEDQENEDVILDFDMMIESEDQKPVMENWHTSGDIATLLPTHDRREVPSEAFVESMDLRENLSSSVLQAEEEKLEKQEYQQVSIAEEPQNPIDDVQANEERRGIDLDVHIASEESGQMQNNEYEAEVSIGTEIPEQEQVDEYQSQDILLDFNQRIQEDPSTSSIKFHSEDDSELLEFKTMSVTTSMQTVGNLFSSCWELNDIEEERVPDTPTSVESLQVQKKLLLLDRKESGTEESLDGSFISDLEGGEVTIEKLKSALISERKVLNSLYAELEEERNASAVAANQTMAMINRLQEEKAAMQMEALQYQRMMEEQSEYDQEALQILNELMVKREKEKQEIEKELERHRKKVHHYEVKEQMVMSRRDVSTRSRTSSVSCSTGTAEDTDGLSVDLNHEAKEENNFENHQERSDQNTPADAVLYIEESMVIFEEERLSILEQLKVLEEKLLVLSDEEDEDEEHFEHMKSIKHEENGNGYYDNLDYSIEVNGIANGHSNEINGKHHHRKRKIMDAKAKRLLPLFDAIDAETEDGLLNGNENGFHFASLQNSPVGKADVEKNKLAMEEEVDHVNERLQALEADREFLKHCISSLRKGDKGLHLLQEILHHLRDLRNVEIRVRNMGDGVLS